MKVVQIITRLIQGGAQAHVVELCEFLRRDGRFDVTLVGGPPLGNEGECIERARALGIPVRVVDSLVRPIHAWHDWRAGRALRRLLEEVKPDLVHTHSAKAGVLGRRAARAAGVPRIFHTLHGLPFHPDQPGWIHAAGAWFERAGARLSEKVICVGKGVHDAARYWEIAPDEKLVTIPCGVDFARFDDRHVTRADLGLPEKAWIVVTVSRLAVGKGHVGLLDAAAEARRTIPDIHLVFVGDGPERARLESYSDLPLTITGMVPPGRVPAFLSTADVVALPSPREGLPLALLEGALAARPLLGLDIDANREIVRDGDNGRLVSDLAEGLLDMHERASHFARGAALALPDFRMRFDKEKTLPQIARLYVA